MREFYGEQAVSNSSGPLLAKYAYSFYPFRSYSSAGGPPRLLPTPSALPLAPLHLRFHFLSWSGYCVGRGGGRGGLLRGIRHRFRWSSRSCMAVKVVFYNFQILHETMRFSEICMIQVDAFTLIISCTETWIHLNCLSETWSMVHFFLRSTVHLRCNFITLNIKRYGFH